MATCVVCVIDYADRLPKRVCYCFCILKRNIHTCLHFRTTISKPQLNAVLCYTHYAINFDENTLYFISPLCLLHCNNNFLFQFTTTFTTPWLRQKILFFLLIIIIISPFLRQDLEKLHIFVLLLRSLQGDYDKKYCFHFNTTWIMKIYFFHFATTFTAP